MEKNFLFIMAPVQIPDAREQLSKALEQLTELCSRTRYPRLWKLTDKLNSMPKLPEEKLRFRRIYRSVLGIINWVLGVLLLMTGLMEPEMIILLAAGAAGYGVGTVILWRRLRKTGGIINLLLGFAALFWGAWQPGCTWTDAVPWHSGTGDRHRIPDSLEAQKEKSLCPGGRNSSQPAAGNGSHPCPFL